MPAFEAVANFGTAGLLAYLLLVVIREDRALAATTARELQATLQGVARSLGLLEERSRRLGADSDCKGTDSPR
jgi:hypothetical protein